jgi:Protein of unknown function (DUF3995)
MMATASLLTLTLGAIALLHGYWAAGGLWPGESKAELAAIVVGRPRMSDMPSAGLSLLVAVLIAASAAWPLLLSPLSARYLGQPIALAGGLIAAAVFLLRGAAGYSTAMKQRHGAEPFATYNRLYYSPLCLAIGAGFLILALNGGIA